MPSSEMLRRVPLVRIDVSEERITVLPLLVTTNVVPSSQLLVVLLIEGISSSEMSVLTEATRSNISEGGILHSHRRENLTSLRSLTFWLQTQRSRFDSRHCQIL
jgi:hypothetical protein